MVISAMSSEEWSSLGDDPVESIFEKIVALGRESFLDQGDLQPVAHVIGKGPPEAFAERDGAHVVHYTILLNDLMENADTKYVLGQIMSTFIRDVRGFCVVMCTEIWTLRGKSKTELAAVYERYGSLSEHPEAIEAISFIIETREGTRARIFPIERAEDGALSLASSIAPTGHGSSEGTFMNWLSDVPRADAN